MMNKGYSLGLYEKSMPASLSWREKLEAAGAAGYDFIEMSIDETDDKLARLDMSQQERLELLGLMAETGVPIQTMCLSGHRRFPLGSEDPEKAAKSLEIMHKAIQLADDLGIRIIQLAGYDVYYESSSLATKKRFSENLKKAVDMASQAGVLLGFETMETEFMNTVEKAMKYVTLVNSCYLNVYPDIGNLTNAAETYKNDVLEDLQLGRGHIVAMHLKETVPGKFREIPFGTGHVAFDQAVQAVWSMGVRRFVTEFWYTDSLDWLQDIKDVYERFSGLLNSLSNNICA